MSTPLTMINDDEKMFVQEVEKFAKEHVAPRMREMDESEIMDPNIIKQCFELGLMGIEVPERFGGSGCSFTLATLVVEALAKTDPSVSVMVDVQNTLINNIFLNFNYVQ